ncbi:MAG: hypothetical protein JW806_00565 [Sedimentisphaerales bacterium]|nr:hypothetical protein [Sedimentisphaerales bacterium]
MTKGLTVLAIGVIGLAAYTHGDLRTISHQAQVHLTANVIPNISVQVISTNIASPDEGRVTLEINGLGGGIVEAEVLFHVIANVERIKFTVLATDLYRDEDPASSWRIPVRTSQGPTIEASYAQPTQDSSKSLDWAQNITYSNGMNAWQSHSREYASSQPKGTFNQNISVKVEYESTEPTIPRGTYGGFIKLVCEVEPL